MQHLTPELVAAKMADLEREAARRRLIHEARRPSRHDPTPGALRRRLGESMVSLGSRLRGEPPCPLPREGRAAA